MSLNHHMITNSRQTIGLIAAEHLFFLQDVSPFSCFLHIKDSCMFPNLHPLSGYTRPTRIQWNTRSEIFLKGSRTFWSKSPVLMTRQLPMGAGHCPWGGYTDRIVCNMDISCGRTDRQNHRPLLWIFVGSLCWSSKAQMDDTGINIPSPTYCP